MMILLLLLSAVFFLLLRLRAVPHAIVLPHFLRSSGNVLKNLGQVDRRSSSSSIKLFVWYGAYVICVRLSVCSSYIDRTFEPLKRQNKSDRLLGSLGSGPGRWWAGHGLPFSWARRVFLRSLLTMDQRSDGGLSFGAFEQVYGVLLEAFQQDGIDTIGLPMNDNRRLIVATLIPSLAASYIYILICAYFELVLYIDFFFLPKSFACHFH